MSFCREVFTLPLPPAVRSRLIAAGYRTTADLRGVGAERLCRVGTTAAQLLDKELKSKPIITFCGELDEILGGGVAARQLTELCGVPGIGKTQIGMQLAVDVQIPKQYGGVGGAAIYVDTEGSFMVERVTHIAEALIKHLRRMAALHPAALRAHALLTGIHYFRVCNLTEQLAVVDQLAAFINHHPQVKLVVLDSVTFHFRHDNFDMPERARTLARLAQDLLGVAQQHDVAVVLMNQVTTKIAGEAHATLAPALGDSWAHAATNRVILYFQDQARMAYLHKSPYLPARTAEYLITTDGVRGRRPQKRQRT